MQKHASIRNVLLLVVGTLTLIITLLAAREVMVNGSKLARINTLQQAMALSDTLFDAVEKFSIERDMTYAMLHSTGADTAALEQQLQENRQAANTSFNTAMRALQRYNFPQIALLRGNIETRLLNLQTLRQKISQAANLPARQREPGLDKRWYEESTELIVQIQDLWMEFAGHFLDVNTVVTRHLRYKHLLRIISDYTGRERAIISRLLVENAAPTVEESAQLLRGQGVLELSWKMAELLAYQSGLHDSIAPYYTDAHSHYLTLADMTRDMFYVPGKTNKKVTYPISVDFWLELSSQATESLNTLKEVSLRETREFVEQLKREAQQLIVLHIVLLLVTLGLCAYSFRAITYRVIRPINAIVDALVQTIQGKEMAFDPALTKREDEIGKLGQVLYAFRENQERYRALVEASAQVIWGWKQGKLDINSPLSRWWEETTGQLAENIGTYGWLDVVHPEDRERVQKIWDEAQAERKNFKMEYRLRTRNGSYIPVEVRGVALREEDGSVREFIGSLSDISERKEAEQAHEQLRQAQKMEAIGQLTGGIAHDFNNLLAVILGNLDLLQEYTKEDDPLRSYIDPSIESAMQGAELTQRLLAFGRKQTLQPKVISPNDLIMHFLVWAPRTLGERIETVTSLAYPLWHTKVDPGQLEGVLLNLSVNARDAMPQGGKIIYETKNVHLDEEYATKHTDVPPGEYVMIAVSDTGVGMTPEVMEKAFEPFFTTKEVGKGTGLGLSMVYGFVKQSAGHIKLYSEPGHGTTIKIYLPRAAEDIAATGKTKPPVAVSNEKKGKTVLIVEDNKNVLKLTSTMVQGMGYDVLTAETGTAALAILAQRKDIDLLLTDVMLPGVLNGPALAEQASRTHPRMRVLFSTGYAEHAIVKSGLLAEGVHVISKPFRKQQLAEKIQELLK